MLEKVIHVIRAQNLLSLVRYSGTCLKKGLHELEMEFPKLISNVRGRGTFLAFTCRTVDIRDKINKGLLDRGKDFLNPLLIKIIPASIRRTCTPGYIKY